MKIQSIYNKLAKFTEAQKGKKIGLSKEKPSPCKYDFSKKRNHWKLSKRNVKLSLVDELTREYEYVEEMTSVASYYAYERIEELEEKWFDVKMEYMIELDNLAVNSGVTYVEEGTEKLAEMLTKIESTADELGMPASELYDNYEEVKELVNNAPGVYDDFRTAYKDFVRSEGFNDFL